MNLLVSGYFCYWAARVVLQEILFHLAQLWSCLRYGVCMKSLRMELPKYANTSLTLSPDEIQLEVLLGGHAGL
jgi:hypothetical protein